MVDGGSRLEQATAVQFVLVRPLQHECTFQIMYDIYSMAVYYGCELLFYC
jgi:hypothetical protein